MFAELAINYCPLIMTENTVRHQMVDGQEVSVYKPVDLSLLTHMEMWPDGTHLNRFLIYPSAMTDSRWRWSNRWAACT